MAASTDVSRFHLTNVLAGASAPGVALLHKLWRAVDCEFELEVALEQLAGSTVNVKRSRTRKKGPAGPRRKVGGH